MKSTTRAETGKGVFDRRLSAIPLKHRVYATLGVLIALFFTVQTVSADPSKNVSRTLWHPSAMGAPLSGQYRLEDPLAVLSLPHLHALASESRLAVAGGGVIGSGTAGGALGLIVPSRRVIWNGAVSILGDDLGSHGRGVLGLARPLGSRLQGGISAGLSFAESDGDLSVGAGIDLGFRYDLGVFRDVSRVDLHAAMLNLGAAAVRDGENPIVPPFTPLAGVRARIISRESVFLDVSGSVSAPAFSDLGFDLGAALVFETGPVVRLGWRGSLTGGENAVWPGVSLGLRFPLGGGADDRFSPTIHGTTQPDRKGNVLVAAEVTTGFESTDQEPPVVTATMIAPSDLPPGRMPGSIALSPEGDDAQLELHLAAVDNRAIAEIVSRILDEDGREVRSWRHAPMVSTVPTGTVTERLVSDLWQRKIAGTLYWDVYDSVPDGLYRLEIVARDRAGNIATAPPMEILVDGTPPFMEAMVVPIDSDGEITGEYVTFRADEPLIDEEVRIAPENDVRFTLRYRDAERLSMEVIDQAGRSVVPLSAQPERQADEQVLSLNWPGTERDGTRIPEGVYRIRAEARDELGNRSVITSPPLLIQSVRPRFTVAISDTVVAPTGDGNRDTITVTPRLEPITGLQEWSLELLDEDGAVVREWSGIDLPPEALVLGRDHFPDDGHYSIAAVSRYRNGAVAGDRTAIFTVDTRAPAVDLIPGRTSIQPDLDPAVPIFLEIDPEAMETHLMVSGPEMAPVPIRSWTRPPGRYDWELLLADGSFLGPGEYSLFLEARDAAGNRGRSPLRSINLLERLEGVRIVPERSVFGPTGNGRFDTLRLSLAGSPDTAAAAGSFTVDIVTYGTGENVRRFSGSLPLPSGIVWDGRNDQGLPVADGEYRAILAVSVPDRGEVRDESSRFSVDTSPPSVGLTVDPPIVSPDGDGRQDELVIRPVLQPVGAARYRLFRDGEEINARLPDPGAGPVEWEPRLADGTVLPDGDYRIVLEQEDEAGNTGRTDPVVFQIDTRPVGGFVRISAPAFAPGSREYPHVTFTPVLPVTRGIDRWQFFLIPEDGGEPLVISEGGGEVLPTPLLWDGSEKGDGDTASDGRYVAVLHARYRHGPVVNVTSPPVLLDSTPPDVEVTVAPEPFSPDGDGIDDTVEFTLAVEDDSPLRYWILEIFDPVGEFFYDVGGRGEPPRRIVWDGHARTGERVVSAERYPWRLEVADDLGNVSVREGTLQVDVLVEPYNGGYRIQLPSIIFPPNSAFLDLDPDSDDGAQNRAVILRLAEILRRFPDYQIVVEGHAVNVSGTEREHREELLPLSRDRAASVRQALVGLGVPARLLTAEGRGGAAPIVPHTDETNRWKNRRVDFLLKR